MVSGSGWNLWVRLTGGGCGCNLWVWLVDVVVRRYIDISSYYLSLLLLYLFFFAAASLLLLIFLIKCFSFLFRNFCKLCKKIFTQ